MSSFSPPYTACPKHHGLGNKSPRLQLPPPRYLAEHPLENAMELLHKYHRQPKHRHEKVDPFHHTWPGPGSLYLVPATKLKLFPAKQSCPGLAGATKGAWH